jgi:hypothetical protein
MEAAVQILIGARRYVEMEENSIMIEDIVMMETTRMAMGAAVSAEWNQEWSVQEVQPVVLIDALSHVAMARTQVSTNAMMETYLMGMAVHLCAMLSQDFNV